MSLFEDSEFQWRETYFILFEVQHRPPAAVVRETLEQLDSRYQLSELQADPEGRFDSITLKSPDDYAAMDISFMEGDEVDEQVQDLLKTIQKSRRDDDAMSQQQIVQLKKSTARLDVLHFEQVHAPEPGDSDEEFLDPGSLLAVLERLKQICHGVVIDPQTGCAM